MNSPLFYLEDNSSQSFSADNQRLNVLLHKKYGRVNGIDYHWAYASDGETVNTFAYENNFQYSPSRNKITNKV